jgi:hypothetical protein
MPWVRIPKERLNDLPLFGYDLIKDEGEFVWYTGPKGRMRIEKNNPRVFLEDVSDAIILDAQEIMVSIDN